MMNESTIYREVKLLETALLLIKLLIKHVDNLALLLCTFNVRFTFLARATAAKRYLIPYTCLKCHAPP